MHTPLIQGVYDRAFLYVVVLKTFAVLQCVRAAHETKLAFFVRPL
jgi:hypothetical protein